MSGQQNATATQPKKLSVQEQIKALKDQKKALDEQTAKLREGITQVKLSDKQRVEIGGKGTINIYGLGRFPVCLYKSQLTELKRIINSKEFNEFIETNDSQLAKKESKEA